MPEGHSVHRIARQFDRNFVGRPVAASSPQGRFVEGAHILSGRTATAVRAVGKQMFLEFDDDLWLRVHLGMYGAWDFAGEIMIDPTIASANGRRGPSTRGSARRDSGERRRGEGQTNQRGTDLGTPILDAAGENSLTSIGAPRRARVHVRMSEQTTGLADEGDEWPPPVVGQSRRLLRHAHMHTRSSRCADRSERVLPCTVEDRLAQLGAPLVGLPHAAVRRGDRGVDEDL
ncbi:MAG: DNA-formamidopyrimidine glycosylase family protein, partial [Microbacterium sp.]